MAVYGERDGFLTEERGAGGGESYFGFGERGKQVYGLFEIGRWRVDFGVVESVIVGVFEKKVVVFALFF